MTRQTARFAAAVMTTLLALVVLWQFRIVFVCLLISLVLAASLRPLINRLAGLGFARRAAWILLYVLVLVCLGVLLFFTVETAIHEAQRLARTVSVQDEWRLPIWLEGSSFQQALVGRLPPPSQLFEAMTGDQGQLILSAILGFTQGLGGIVSGALVILFLSVHWSIHRIHFERLWLSLLPSGQRKRARGIWRTLELDLGAYVRGEGIQALLAGLVLGLGYALLGSPYPAVLAMFGALGSLIPVVGIAVAVVPVLLVGLLTSVQLSLLTGVYALFVLTALGIWVKPRLFDRGWDNPILTVLLLIAMADAFGLVGIILAPLVSLVCQILWSRLVSHPGAVGAAAELSDLKERYARAWALINTMDEPPMPLVTSSMTRFAGLMERAERLLQEDRERRRS
jgi:predicted PurR-regulated permease PerM